MPKSLKRINFDPIVAAIIKLVANGKSKTETRKDVTKTFKVKNTSFYKAWRMAKEVVDLSTHEALNTDAQPVTETEPIQDSLITETTPAPTIEDNFEALGLIIERIGDQVSQMSSDITRVEGIAVRAKDAVNRATKEVKATTTHEFSPVITNTVGARAALSKAIDNYGGVVAPPVDGKWDHDVTSYPIRTLKRAVKERFNCEWEKLSMYQVSDAFEMLYERTGYPLFDECQKRVLELIAEQNSNGRDQGNGNPVQAEMRFLRVG